MSEIKDGGPAFPVSTRPMEGEPGYGHQDGHTTWQYGGVTVRDYFAAKAMPLVLPICSTYESAASEAYKVANAMLRARGEA